MTGLTFLSRNVTCNIFAESLRSLSRASRLFGHRAGATNRALPGQQLFGKQDAFGLGRSRWRVAGGGVA